SALNHCLFSVSNKLGHFNSAPCYYFPLGLVIDLLNDIIDIYSCNIHKVGEKTDPLNVHTEPYRGVLGKIFFFHLKNDKLIPSFCRYDLIDIAWYSPYFRQPEISIKNQAL